MPRIGKLRLRIIDPAATTDWRDRLRDHYLRLDPESRLSRFMTPVSDRGLAALVERAAPVLLVLFEPDGEVRGCAEVHLGDGPGTAEIAVSVEAPWQSQGVGARLTAMARRAAWACGFDDVRLMCLRRNERMVRIARALSARALPLADWALALFRFDGLGQGPGAPGGMAAG